MKRSFVCLLFACCLCYCTVTEKTLKVEEGVSQELAQYRKEVLSNVLYDLSFHIPQLRSDSIIASETISFNLAKNNRSLQLDFKEKEHRLRSVSVNGTKITAPFLQEHIVIEARHLKTGYNEINIQFIAGELSLNRNNDYLYTLLVPDRARTVFPCFDQPDIKAKFKLALLVPKDWTVLTNAPVFEVKDSAQTKKYWFQPSDVFSTYLFSFVAGKFAREVKQIDGHQMNFYYRETDTKKISLSVDSIFELHKQSLAFLENYTQIKYPFQKFDFVAIPDFQYGGMEHVGAIDYNANALFLDSGATKDQHNRRSNLIAHETSHMWFGDLVTMKWFNDVWMKEVFANFIADKVTQGNKADDSYFLKFLLTHFPSAYNIDRTQGANPIRQSLPNLNQAGSLYGPIIYNKAPIMMRQLELLTGEDALREGLREYLKKFQHGNADWPDLIKILDEKTPVDLVAWNQVWVNTAGRPVIDYVVEQKNGIINRLSLTQRGELQNSYLLPQYFKIALVYNDHVDELDVNMNQDRVELPQAKGKKMPEYFLFNSSGEGYGLFPLDKNYDKLATVTNPVMKASAYINLYENMLDGKIPPVELIKFSLKALDEESNELTANLLTGYISRCYWKWLDPSTRKEMAPGLEKELWRLMHKDSVAGKKKTLFRTFQSIVLTKPAQDSLYFIWKEQKPPSGIRISEDEYISMALNLKLREYPDDSILVTQLNRTSNEDRKSRLQFLMPALSKDVGIRDGFFESLKDIGVRKKESWTIDALEYLHHPLRSATSIRYLNRSLEMLEEIQRTNDIFFPANWLNASFGNYQSKEAGDIVRKFLGSHPDYNPQLKMKILQAADALFRAEKLVYN